MLGFRSKSKSETMLTVSNRTVIRILLLGVLTLVGITVVKQASHALLLIFTAFFLALSLNAPVHWIAKHIPGKRRGSRSIATAVSFILVIALMAGFFASIVPPLVKQTDSFITAAPSLVRQAKSENSPTGRFIKKYNLEPQIQKFSSELGDRLKNATGAAVSTIGEVGSSIFAVLTILVLTFMMLVEGPRWMLLFKDMIPDEHHDRAQKIAQDMYKVIKGYVNGQVLLAAVASVLILPAVIILHISYPIALAVVIFICGLIPLVGHTLGAIIVTIVALFTSPLAAVIILIYYFLYQQIENYLIQPRIQANSTNMSPLLVFSSVIIGVSFGGIFGGLVAIPVAGCVRIAVLDYLKRKKIIDTVEYNEATTGKPSPEHAATK